MGKLDEKTANYLAEKSAEMINKQVENYREKRSVSATIIGLNTLFIPFFLSGIAEAPFWIKGLALVALILLGLAIHYLLMIYHLNYLEQGLAVSKYDETINKSYEDAILFEIGANRDSYNENKLTLEKINSSYAKGISFTKIAIGFSVILLTLNTFFPKKDKEPLDVKITNIDMTTPGNNSNNGGNTNTNTNNGNGGNTGGNADPVVIPATNPNDRERIKEGKEPK